LTSLSVYKYIQMTQNYSQVPTEEVEVELHALGNDGSDVNENNNCATSSNANSSSGDNLVESPKQQQIQEPAINQVEVVTPPASSSTHLNPKPGDDTLPAYDGLEETSGGGDGSTKLPSYEEYESNLTGDSPYVISGNETYTSLEDTYISDYGLVLGNDSTFCASFLFSLLFANMPVVFFFIFCCSKTLAGRCGAMSGFGLGLCRFMFSLIPAHSPTTPQMGGGLGNTTHSSHLHHVAGEAPPMSNSVMWFVVMWGVLCGWFCLLRGIGIYLNCKKAITMAQLNQEIARGNISSEVNIDDLA